MIEAQARAAKAEEMAEAWSRVALAWFAVERCSRYRPECLTEAAQYARAAEDAACERDAEMVEHWFGLARAFGYPSDDEWTGVLGSPR
jgi:hypothetical protein